MTLTACPPNPIHLPDPDVIRAAIDAANERVRLLRRLLRIAMHLHRHHATANRLHADQAGTEADRG